EEEVGMRRRRALTIALFAVLALTVAACGTTNPTAQLKEGGTITIDNESGTLWTCGFNPFNANVNSFAFGPVYEPLVYNNLLNGKTTPMLASSYKWSSDSKTLTFTTRSGVKWTDGQPFTAADVVYTFKLMKTNSALDLQSVWTVLSDVTQQGSDQVVMTFTTPAVPYFYYIAGQVAIVPEHIWSQIKYPVGENMPKPIGPGTFTVAHSTLQNIPYQRNPNYWQAGLPHIAKVNYPAFLDNDPANAYLASGQAQWGGQFIPNIDTYYVAKDPKNNHYWFPPIDNINVWFNTTRAPLNNKAVRQAIAYSIDRPSVSQKGEFGYEPPGNQTGVLSPTFDSWIDKAQADTYGYKFDVAKAQGLLQQAGFTKGSSGIFQDSSGKKLSLSI